MTVEGTNLEVANFVSTKNYLLLMVLSAPPPILCLKKYKYADY